MKVPVTDMDYVELYAEKLLAEPLLFEQQKMLINSQLKSSKETFKKMFSSNNYEVDARAYLRAIGLI